MSWLRFAFVRVQHCLHSFLVALLCALLLLGLMPLTLIPAVAQLPGAHLLQPKAALAQSPTLELTKSVGTTTIQSGVPFEYILTYKCASITTHCTDARIIDTLPAGLAYVAGTATVTSHIQTFTYTPDGTGVTGGKLEWIFKTPSLPAGSTGVLRFSARFRPGVLPGTVTNAASFTASNAVSTTVQSGATTSTGQFEMFAQKSGGPAVIGFPTNFSLGICSPDEVGGIRLTNAVITDTLPADAIFIDAEGTENVDWVYTPTVAPDRGGSITFTTIPTVEVGGCLTRVITLRYDSNPGVQQTNRMTVTGQPEDGTPAVVLTDNHDFGVIAPYPEGTIGKGSTSPSAFAGPAANPNTEALPGEAVTYTVNVANTGYLTLTNVTITDVIPVELDLQSWTLSATITKPITGFYEINSDGNWLALPNNPYTSSQTIAVTGLGLSSGDKISKLRWDIGAMDVLPQRTPGYSIQLAGLVTNTLSFGDSFQNCAFVKATELTTTLSSCNTVDIIAPRVIPRVSKSHSGASFLPLDYVDFTVELSNPDVAHLPLDNPVLADLLPAPFTYVIGSATFISTSAPSAPAPNLSVTNNYSGTGRTLLRWRWQDESGSGGTDASYSLAPGEKLIVTYRIQVADGTPPGDYSNSAALIDWTGPTNPDLPAVDAEKILLCARDSALVYNDSADLDGDGLTTEASCQQVDPATVAVALAMESEKFVRGTLDCENTTDYGPATTCEDADYNKLGLTVLGGDVDYRLIMTNTSNVSVTKITLIDIFPHIGDTGVIDPQARQSAWRPNLQAAINAPSGLPLTIYYSTEENPCRTELVSGGPSGCQPANWTTTLPADPTSVQAIKLEFCNANDPTDCVVLPRGGSLEFDWHMVAPNIAPVSADCLTPAGDSFDWQNKPACQIAWNSFGFTAFEAKDVDGTPGNDSNALQLPATEPIRVGMRIGPDDKYALGDYVWLDIAGLQNDGIQQPVEQTGWGVSGVRVELYDSANTFIGYRYTGPDQNGDPGFYQFSNLNPGDYYLRFFPPDGYNATQQQVGVGGHDLDDSDGITESVDGVYGNYWQSETFAITATTTISNYTPAWDFGLWLPTDYGDAPSTYPVTATNAISPELAARHIIVDGFHLGVGVDDELDGQPGAASEDDVNNETDDDEDGVRFPDYVGTEALPTGVLFVGNSASLTITGTKPATLTGLLNAWIDWNGDGAWSSDEQIAADWALNGVQTLNVTVPNTATLGTTYARFRYGSASGLQPTGTARDGEVEDYKVVILSAPVKSIASTSAGHTSGTDLTIGEVVRYRLQVALPEGVLTNFQIADALPAGLQYSNTVTVSQIADSGVISTSLTITGTPFSDGTDPIFAFGTITNTDSDVGEELLIVEFDAVVLNTIDNQAGRTLDNVFTVSFDTVSKQSNTVQVSLVEPVLTLTKAVSAPPPMNPGSVVTYTVTLVHAGGSSADAFDLVYTDTLPAGLTNPVVQSISVNGTPSGLTSAVTGNGIRVSAMNDGSFDLPQGDTVVIVYTAQLAAAVEPGDQITNGAGVVCSTLDGDDPNERTGNGPEPDGSELLGSGALDDYERADNATFTVTGDWGDAPNSYATTRSNATAFAGPAHFITDTLYLGASVDDENDGQPNGAATGDDTVDAPDDEDGITFLNPIVPRRTISVEVTIHDSGSNPAYLFGWLDFDGDGTFTQSADQIFSSEPVFDGVQILTFSVPATATQNIPTYARFRLSTDPLLDFYGLAADGEVEDYETYIEPLGSIGDRIWYDRDFGGDDDGGLEVGLNDITVQLTYPNGAVITTATSITGHYLFTDLPPGAYGVTVITSTLPLTVVHTPTADPDGGANSISSVTLTRPLHHRLDQDFGYPPELLAIGNQVWIDFGAGAGFANNGQRDGSESGRNGVTVELYDSTDTPGIDSPLASTTTANGGFYLFDNLFYGDYIVHIPASNFTGVLNGYVSSTDAGGDVATDDNLDENGDDTPVNGGVSSSVITLFPHTEPTSEAGVTGAPVSSQDDDNTNLTVDFGFTIATTSGCLVGNNDLGGSIWYDDSGDGVRDGGEVTFIGTPGPIIITAYNDAGVQVGVTLVQPDGTYVLPGLFAANSAIRLEFSDLPPDVRSGPAGSNQATTVQFVTAATCDADLGLIEPGPTSAIEIGNYVWEDIDRDGIQDPSEEPIPGVEVTLYDITGTVIATATTDNGGEYYFIDANDSRLSTTFIISVPTNVGVVPATTAVGGLLPNTQYRIGIDTTQSALFGYKLTSANVDSGTTLADSVDSDGVRNGDFAVVDLTTGPAGENDHSFDFGFWPFVNLGNRLSAILN
jgi:uncharacterized repeat protein (TIGR01451 family)/fimbrial isopeptide formation D2 family protein